MIEFVFDNLEFYNLVSIHNENFGLGVEISSFDSFGREYQNNFISMKTFCRKRGFDNIYLVKLQPKMDQWFEQNIKSPYTLINKPRLFHLVTAVLTFEDDTDGIFFKLTWSHLFQ